jgi:hypothetical protein
MSTKNAFSKGPNRDVSTESSHTWANLLRKGASLSRGRLRDWAISVCDFFTKLGILAQMVSGVTATWRKEVWRRDLDTPYCCNGYMCGCHASTVRDMWTHKYN